MREVRIHQLCDWCRKRNGHDTECQSSISFTVGKRAMRYDHCEIGKHANPAWSDMLELANADEEERALPPRRPLTSAANQLHDGPPSGELIACPQCGQERRGRGGAIKHLVGVHGMGEVEASHLVKPPGRQPSTDCDVCGYLVVVGTGYSSHVMGAHGEQEWERIKASLQQG